MEIIGIILGILVIILSGYLFFLFREFKKINRELSILEEGSSNLILTTSISNQTMKKMINKINHIYEKYRKQSIMIAKQDDYFRKSIINVSHDLRTPLTASLGYVHMLEEEALEEEKKAEYLGIIETRLNHLNDLIDQFFELSKGMVNPSVEFEVIKPVMILYEVASLYYEEFQDRRIDFQIENEQITLFLNSLMLERIYMNLFDNFIRYGGDYLRISAKEENGLTLIFENHLNTDIDFERIFERFYTSDISRSNGGTGLGLAIVKEFIERLGGTIHVVSKDSLFSLVLHFPYLDRK